jgi:hypothetical protein
MRGALWTRLFHPAMRRQLRYYKLRSAMKNRLRRCVVILSLAAACLAQRIGDGGDIQPGTPRFPQPMEAQSTGDVKLPNGKSQKDEILRIEYAQNLRDARELVELSQQLRDSLEKSDRHVLSLADLKKIEDIEKLTKKIHNRLRHN